MTKQQELWRARRRAGLCVDCGKAAETVLIGPGAVNVLARCRKHRLAWNARARIDRASLINPLRLARQRIDEALGIAIRYGQIDGDHHKAWVIDQIVRALTGEDYEDTIRHAKAGSDGPETYEWETGIPP